MIQASYTRALDRGLTLDDMFACARDGRGRRLGRRWSAWCRTASSTAAGRTRSSTGATAAGFSGAIVPDLPIEEAEASPTWPPRSDFKLIQLVTPTTPPERAESIARRVDAGSCTASA